MVTGTSHSDCIVIGAGIGGLATAARLASAGARVVILERHAHAGGKIRTLPSAAGPVDAGPTVLTMPHIFEEIFSQAGARMADYVSLIRAPLLARHFWPDGTTLDLFEDHGRNLREITQTFGPKSAAEFEAFAGRTSRLFEAFLAPVMTAPRPNILTLTKTLARNPRLIADMAPGRSMAGLLDQSFSDARLRTLFARYATYVGGSPSKMPALTNLIWEAERGGVWQAKGGMSSLTQGLQRLIEDTGGSFRFRAEVAQISRRNGRARSVTLSDGQSLSADAIVFNGDPAALRGGLLGPDMTRAVRKISTTPRSHSAHVWSFAATTSGQPLAMHNVFFADEPKAEFVDLADGRAPTAPSIYVHAQDVEHQTKPGRFEIILNAPARHNTSAQAEEFETCHEATFRRLAQMGVSFQMDTPPHLSTPSSFAQLFPGSAGAIYGRSPHGMMATFLRPSARTRITGLYLAGGGCHPGAGIPMAALSGKHAATAVLSDRISTSRSHRTDTHGGMSMEFQPTASTRSR